MSIEQLRNRFISSLEKHNREEAVSLIMDALDNNVISVHELYEEILTKSLNSIASNEKTQEITIWEEHLWSNIVRSIIELTLPFVYRQRQEQEKNILNPIIRKKAIVFCLEEEYHELGARMTTDFLILLGFDAFFIGANTPKREILSAIQYFEPDLVCVSITNYYHLTKLHQLIQELKNIEQIKPFTFVVGGYAIHHSSEVKKQIEADYYITSFNDLIKVKEAMQ